HLTHSWSRRRCSRSSRFGDDPGPRASRTRGPAAGLALLGRQAPPAPMSDALFWHRLQFAFTIVYHYLFPQLTMGRALLTVIMKALALLRRGPGLNDAARFWIRIFGINFAIGVVTGLPMELQFGTNWAEFSRIAGKVVGHTL